MTSGADPVARAPAGDAPGKATVPRATYRLQFHKGFDFDAAATIVPYLARLGISHVYCSPILRARPGSLHGYDIVAHDEINPELGGQAGFDRFSAALREQGMGQILDIVPNHMGVLGADNAWWMDVLENGPASPYAGFFDIDWHPVDPYLDGKVLVPVLGDHYGNEIESEHLMLVFEAEAGSLSMRYHEHRFPLDPGTYPAVLEPAITQMNGSPARGALAEVSARFARLPGRASATAPTDVAARVQGITEAKAVLAKLAGGPGGVAQALQAAVAGFNVAGHRDPMHQLLEAQPYRLSYWRVASDEINYRRFFDINELAALRMEHEDVFEATHRLILDLTAAGIVDGLRIDHPDGLSDPAAYFWRLQQGHALRCGLPPPPRAPRGRPDLPLYVVVEKITAPHERVPEAWHVHGTTGYRYAMVVNGVLLDTTARRRFDRIWRSFTQRPEPFHEYAYQGKRAIMRSSLASELTRLATRLLRIARGDPRTRDYTFNTLRLALSEVAACMPVYRTYITDAPGRRDLQYVDWAIAHARRRSRAADTTIFGFVRHSLLGQPVEGAAPGLHRLVRRFAAQFQQFTSPVAAKGVEDTAFYRFSRLVSLNEVGGDPEVFGITLRAFHGASADRAATWPHTLIATSTHDNKRSEDVRNRINVLSEMPAGWRLALKRWRQLNRAHRRLLDGRACPSAPDEYLLYQTLLGTLPIDRMDEDTLAVYRERVAAYLLKATREAKEDTSWISPDADYEDGLAGFINGLLGRTHPNPFLDDLCLQSSTVAWYGALNSIAMAVIKFTSPGVPDIYQGNEILDFSLVDPDNRRPVDYALRERMLAELQSMASEVSDSASERVTALLANPHDGRAKLWVTWRLLELRRQRPELFCAAGYAPLKAAGRVANHVLAYRRHSEGQSMVVVSGRLFARLDRAAGTLPLGEAWRDTRVEVPGVVEGTPMTDVLSGTRITAGRNALELRTLLSRFPAAVLVYDEPAH